MARWLFVPVLVVLAAAAPARAEDLSHRLEQLEREAASRPPADAETSDSIPELAPETPRPPAEARHATPPTPANARFTEIQERRARDYRERAATAGRRAALDAQNPARTPELDERTRSQLAESARLAKQAADVFKPGTEEYQAAYDEWLAGEEPAAPAADPPGDFER